MKFESADLIYQQRGIQKCNKMGGITDSKKDMFFGKKVFDELVRCILKTHANKNGTEKNISYVKKYLYLYLLF
jgi:hypothetical protein